MNIEDHRKMQDDVHEARLAVFLERASTAAYEVVHAKSQGVVGDSLDRMRAKRDHWLKEVQEHV